MSSWTRLPAADRRLIYAGNVLAAKLRCLILRRQTLMLKVVVLWFVWLEV
ncbi:MAG: hypothetical protein HY735_00050 [Verrucomicrobia bacterium]|nr:hypothetical protein [Verrucomicrobiota bacterium]